LGSFLGNPNLGIFWQRLKCKYFSNMRLLYQCIKKITFIFQKIVLKKYIIFRSR